MTGPDLTTLLTEAASRTAAMSHDERRAMLQRQLASYVRGEAEIGSDADEAAWAEAITNGDVETLARLQAESDARVAAADEVLRDRGNG